MNFSAKIVSIMLATLLAVLMGMVGKIPLLLLLSNQRDSKIETVVDNRHILSIKPLTALTKDYYLNHTADTHYNNNCFFLVLARETIVTDKRWIVVDLGIEANLTDPNGKRSHYYIFLHPSIVSGYYLVGQHQFVLDRTSFNDATSEIADLRIQIFRAKDRFFFAELTRLIEICTPNYEEMKVVIRE